VILHPIMKLYEMSPLVDVNNPKKDKGYVLLKEDSEEGKAMADLFVASFPFVEVAFFRGGSYRCNSCKSSRKAT